MSEAGSGWGDVVWMVWAIVSSMMWGCGPQEPEARCGPDASFVSVGGESSCRTRCRQMQDCLVDQTCVNASIDVPGVCVDAPVRAECGSDDECAPGRPFCEAGSCVGFRRCSDDDVCLDGEVCESGVCAAVEEAAECQMDSSCGELRVCVGGECELDPELPHPCEGYCEKVFSSACTNALCGSLGSLVVWDDARRLKRSCLDGVGDPTGRVKSSCMLEYDSDPQFAALVDWLSVQQCRSSSGLLEEMCRYLDVHEECDCDGMTVGTACSVESECGDGELEARCEVPSDPEGSGFEGGYCMYLSCELAGETGDQVLIGPTTGCGDEGVCLTGWPGASWTVCHDACQVRGDCRPGQICHDLAREGTEVVGMCAPRCVSNEDCRRAPEQGRVAALESHCNSDGRCERPCNPTRPRSCDDPVEECVERPGLNSGSDSTGSCELILSL